MLRGTRARQPHSLVALEQAPDAPAEGRLKVVRSLHELGGLGLGRGLRGILRS